METNDINKKIGYYKIKGKQLRKSLIISKFYTSGNLKPITLFLIEVIIYPFILIEDIVQKDMHSLRIWTDITIFVLIIILLTIYGTIKNTTKANDGGVETKLQIDFYQEHLVYILSGRTFKLKTTIYYEQIEKVIAKKGVTIYITNNFNYPIISVIDDLVRCDNKLEFKKTVLEHLKKGGKKW